MQTVLLSIFTQVSIIKGVISVMKIGLCIAIMLYVIEKAKDIDYMQIMQIFSIINLCVMIFALTLGKGSFLWRFNDEVNKYSLTRMQLFFLEPSELGFHVALVMIFLLSYFFVTKDIKNKVSIVMLFIINAICLILAKPMGSICILALAIGVMVTCWLIKHPTKRNIIIYVSIVLVAIVAVIVLTIQQNPIIMRVIDTVNGTDQSNNYRVGTSIDTYVNTMKDYNLLGCGFGNIHTDRFINRYNLDTVIVNSFIYFWIETGVFGITITMILFYHLLSACIRDKSVLKWGLFVFLIVYQLVGSHFTSPLNWALYGLILSNFHEENRKEANAYE